MANYRAEEVLLSFRPHHIHKVIKEAFTLLLCPVVVALINGNDEFQALSVKIFVIL